LNAKNAVSLADGVPVEIECADDWREVRKRLPHVDVLVIDCRDTLFYRIAMHFVLLPWRRKPLVAVDLVLRKPKSMRHRVGIFVKRLLFRQVAHFIHYFHDISGYTKYFGIRPQQSSFVPFKVNDREQVGFEEKKGESYVFTMGRSLRDYDTFIRAIAQLPYPAAIPEFSFDRFEGRDRRFRWTRENIPTNLRILSDEGGSRSLLRNLAQARVVVVPILRESLCASGLSTYLDAMYQGKCVIISNGPGASDVLTDQAIFVVPEDVTALKGAIQMAWEDDALRHRTAEAGQRYARSLGGEDDLLRRIFREAVRVISN
jgi:glycosyltransferase involved in cell wall biosynthesis